MSHCENCDRLLATDEDAKRYAGGEGEHLCWSRDGNCEPENWRERALRAEAKASRFMDELRACGEALQQAQESARHFKEVAMQRSLDYLAANAERVKAVAEANNPSMEVPCSHCGTKFQAEEFTCGDCLEDGDEEYIVEAMRDAALKQREACAENVYPEGIHWAAVVRATPLVTEGDS